MKIYLDNCCYNRPFDDQTQIKIYLETVAKLHVQNQIKNGKYNLVWSYVLDYENKNNPYEDKKSSISPWRYIAKYNVTEENEEILTFAENLLLRGLKKYDSLHISCAVYSKCKYFLTTDKKLLKTTLNEIKIVNPIDFIKELE